MAQEDKELLLLKDLSARLTYGVIVDIKYNKEHGSSDRLRICSEGSLMLNADLIGLCIEKEIHLKPYLRTMSSMTEEERKEYERFSRCSIGLAPILMDWLYSHHFDYRGLIEKGLALEASKGMYNIK